MAFFFKKQAGQNKLAADFILWERHLEELKAPRAEAWASVQAQQELAITGQGDPTALKQAQAVLCDFDQKVAACTSKLATLQDQLNQAAMEVLDQEIAAAPGESAALETEQMDAGAEMIRAMTKAAFLQNHYFKSDSRVTEIGFKNFDYGVPSHLVDLMETFQKIYQDEIDRLSADESRSVTFFARVQRNRRLRSQFNESNFRDPAIRAIVRAAISQARGEDA
jgi:hypothetical protein